MPSGEAWCYQAAQQLACVKIYDNYDMVSGATVWECGYTGIASTQLRTVRKESGCAQTEIKQPIPTLSLPGMKSRFFTSTRFPAFWLKYPVFGTLPLIFITPKLNVFLAH